MDNKRYTLEQLKNVDPELYSQIMQIKAEQEEQQRKLDLLANAFWDMVEKSEKNKDKS